MATVGRPGLREEQALLESCCKRALLRAWIGIFFLLVPREHCLEHAASTFASAALATTTSIVGCSHGFSRRLCAAWPSCSLERLAG